MSIAAFSAEVLQVLDSGDQGRYIDDIYLPQMFTQCEIKLVSTSRYIIHVHVDTLFINTIQ